MSANKEALLRYRAINKCLINGQVVSKQRLLAACNEAVGHDVAWRTIAEDIRAMRNDEKLGYLAPIENVKGLGYCYGRKDYSIDEIPLNNEELEAIKFASSMLNQFKEVDLFATFSGAMQKISDKVNIQLTDIKDKKTYISFEESTADGGSTYIEDILEHINNEIVLSITYQSFSSGTLKTFDYHPYFIKEYRNRWYVIGWHQKYEAMRILALERIQKAESNYKIKYQKSDFDVNSYYRNVLGISIESGEVKDILLKVKPKDYQFLETQPLHHSQKLEKQEGGHYYISLKLSINYELKSTLLALGTGVEVIKPSDFRKEIKSLLQGSLAAYENI